MAKTLKDLFLAMLNATLILVALCLVLALLVVNRANSLTATFAQNLSVVGPLQETVQETGSEIAALRADLATIGSQSEEVSSATMERLQARAAAMETRLQQMQDNLAELRNAPEQMIDHAIEKAGDEAVSSVARIRGCVPPETVSTGS